MSTIQLVPSRLAELVEQHASTSSLQAGISWSREQWLRWLPWHQALFDRLPEHVSREDVEELAAEVDDTPKGAVQLFVASMVWGFGRVGYGPYRTHRVLEANPQADAKLQRVRHSLANDGPLAAYQSLSSTRECRLRWLGPAFGTKFLHFASTRSAGRRALILDRIVAAWLRTHTGLRVLPWTWHTATYERYLRVMGSWSESLDTPVERLETLIFLDEPDAQPMGPARSDVSEARLKPARPRLRT